MTNHGTTILLVEDDPLDRELIRTAFREIGETDALQSVNDGLQAIAYLMGEGIYSDRIQYPYPSFIITDLKMPGADGFDVLEHLKANPAWAIIPTVVLTGSADPDDIRTAYRLGASSYHVKPADLRGLNNQLKILHDYWMTCKVPAVDRSGKQLHTVPKDKLSAARFPLPNQSQQTRVKK